MIGFGGVCAHADPYCAVGELIGYSERRQDSAGFSAEHAEPLETYIPRSSREWSIISERTPSTLKFTMLGTQFSPEFTVIPPSAERPSNI